MGSAHGKGLLFGKIIPAFPCFLRAWPDAVQD